ncbi:hypothetical protein LK07_33035 [Streptomyces pluripotens]|uniref:Transposase IS204/IS1001/IS1096/IS1165 zinc-finger domain-containing protein n=1 Tax=Streptomyces pluripotens TaxID=1355015 RepID=A0A221P7G6_9ACTN|nr:hypothetical protein LK07_33035 [Streptomyces pluripotens]
MSPARSTPVGEVTPPSKTPIRSHARTTDAALGGPPVRIELSVRRLYCENSHYPKGTFAEQIDGLTVRHQRRTPLS